jgi:hypothetical protein
LVSKKTISLAKGHINIEDIVATSLDNGGYNDKVFETKIGMCGSSFFCRNWDFIPNKYYEAR